MRAARTLLLLGVVAVPAMARPLEPGDVDRSRADWTSLRRAAVTATGWAEERCCVTHLWQGWWPHHEIFRVESCGDLSRDARVVAVEETGTSFVLAGEGTSPDELAQRMNRIAWSEGVRIRSEREAEDYLTILVEIFFDPDRSAARSLRTPEFDGIAWIAFTEHPMRVAVTPDGFVEAEAGTDAP